MTEGYRVKDVTSDSKFLLSLSKIFDADDEGYLITLPERDRFTHRLDNNDKGKPIVLFQDPMPKDDVYFLNLFSEGLGQKSPASSFFYKVVETALNLNFRTAVLHVTHDLLNSKKAIQSGEEYNLSHVVVRMSSVPVDGKTSLYDLVDDKLVDEFGKLFSRVDDNTLFVNYLRPHMTAVVRCDPLSDPNWNDKYGKDIRKKSLLAFRSVLMGVLGINTPEEMNQFSVKYDPDLKSAAKLHTTMTAYLKLYSRFNDVLNDSYQTEGVSSTRDAVDLGELASVIERFPAAYAIAKHMVQPVLPTEAPTSVKAVGTTHLNLGGSPPGQTRRVPGPMIVGGGNNTTLPLGQPMLGQSKFPPVVVRQGPVDPFSPVVQPVTQQVGMGFGQPTPGFGGGFGGGGFGQLNLTPPQNFNSPGVRTYI